MKYVSCGARTLYGQGGFFEDPSLLQEISAVGPAGEDIQTIFAAVPLPPRPRPETLHTGSEEFRTGILELYRQVEARQRVAAATQLVRLRDVLLKDDVLYPLRNGERCVLYETHRSNDRPYVPFCSARELTEGRAQRVRSFLPSCYFYLGSAGTSNYGHWLVDDLPRIKALGVIAAREPGKRIVVLLTSSVIPGQQTDQKCVEQVRVDRMRAETIRSLMPGPVWIRFLDRGRIYAMKHLYYVSPVSFHPTVKSPDALRFVAEWAAPGRNGTERIFVTRGGGRGRNLLNQDAIWQLLLQHGFTLVDPQTLPFAQQAARFASARVVIGVMGAAMTNTVFCAPGTRLLYLAPEEWVEPFYWDLAAMRAHRYNVVFGVSDDISPSPHLRDFRIDETVLRLALQSVLAA